MHRLASKACQDCKGLTGIVLTGKPNAFIKKALLLKPASLISVLRGKLATVAKTSIIADTGNLQKIFKAAPPSLYFPPGLVSKPIFNIPEKEYLLINEVTSAYSLLNMNYACEAVILLKVKHEN